MYKKRKDRTVIVIVLETMKSRIVFSVFRVGDKSLRIMY